ncbi:Hypothetical membrane associated protein [Bifidobacterium animalis subsp. lactis CNCM I-2494]|uniref:Hypothetical membrane associated protein n=1 Tax=Bifidobacterium animalis subsp. lactis CNCM I-2494 TaxID=1042403 RepID=A0A806FST8_BIFAN|nr:Hypothetical membrane associated protein [Bifidobacterium animalis subsp. lactis CNCM I-2494]
MSIYTKSIYTPNRGGPPLASYSAWVPRGRSGRGIHAPIQRSLVGVGVVVLGLPVVDEGLPHVIPAAGALRVGEHGLAELVLPLLRRHHREVPGDLLLAGFGVLDGLLDERVVALHLVEGLERRGEAHVFRQRLDALIGGDDPVQEVLRGLLVGFGGLRIDAQAVLGTGGGQALVLLALGTDVDREHTHLIGLHAGLLQVGPCPGAVLVERGLAECELGVRVVTGLRAQLRRGGGGILEVQVEDVLEVRQVGALDRLRLRGHTVLLELIGERDVRQVGLETPVGAGVEACGGEGALDAELVLLGLHVVRDFLELVEGVDLLGVLDLGARQLGVLLEQVLVVDDAVVLHDVRNAHDLVAVLQRAVLVVELVVDAGVLEVGGVALPVLVVHLAVDLEDRRRIALGELGLERLLIGARGGRLHLHLHAGLVGVFLGERDPLVGGLRLEVQEVDLALAVVRAASATRGQAGQRHCGDRHETHCCFHCAIHLRTFPHPTSATHRSGTEVFS